MVEEHHLVTAGTSLYSAAIRKYTHGVQPVFWKACLNVLQYVLIHYSIMHKEYKSELPENKSELTVTLSLLSLKSLRSSSNLNQMFSEFF